MANAEAFQPHCPELRVIYNFMYKTAQQVKTLFYRGRNQIFVLGVQCGTARATAIKRSNAIVSDKVPVGTSACT